MGAILGRVHAAVQVVHSAAVAGIPRGLYLAQIVQPSGQYTARRTGRRGRKA